MVEFALLILGASGPQRYLNEHRRIASIDIEVRTIVNQPSGRHHVDHLKTIVFGNVDRIDQRGMNAIANRGQLFSRFSLSNIDTNERHENSLSSSPSQFE
jgi:hypothetical protein